MPNIMMENTRGMVAQPLLPAIAGGRFALILFFVQADSLRQISGIKAAIYVHMKTRG